MPMPMPVDSGTILHCCAVRKSWKRSIVGQAECKRLDRSNSGQAGPGRAGPRPGSGMRAGLLALAGSQRGASKGSKWSHSKV